MKNPSADSSLIRGLSDAVTPMGSTPSVPATFPAPHVFSHVATASTAVTAAQVRDVVAQVCPSQNYRGQRILLIIPDGTRTAPVGTVFKHLHETLGPVVRALDVLVALGTHQAMSESAICQRLEISLAERQTTYSRVSFFNHEWDNPAALKQIGTIPAEEIRRLSEERFSMEVAVTINRRLFDYDQVVIIGPVFPHEVVGFSGGNKYLFPGVSGPEILNFFHWLAALMTNPVVIGRKWTPVRRVVDYVGGMVRVDKLCFALVVHDSGLAGIFAGTPEAAWDAASDLSAQLHIGYYSRPFHTILSCAPAMYDDLWTGGKCMYKLEPVLAEGGELIIYAPHITQVSVTHGKTLEEIGYHCRDYYVNQWDRFKHHPWGVIAHSTQVFGQGTFANGVEKPRAQVTLATRISEERCQRINLGYRDPKRIRAADFAHREDEGVLLVPKAGERLYRLS